MRRKPHDMKLIMESWRSFQRKDLRTVILEQSGGNQKTPSINKRTGGACNSFAQIGFLRIREIIYKAVPRNERETIKDLVAGFDADLPTGKAIRRKEDVDGFGDRLKVKLMVKALSNYKNPNEGLRNTMNKIGEGIKSDIDESLRADLAKNQILSTVIEKLNTIGDGEALGTRFLDAFADGIAELNPLWYATVAAALIVKDRGYQRKIEDSVATIERRAIAAAFRSDQKLASDLVRYVLNNTVFKYTAEDLVDKLGMKNEKERSGTLGVMYTLMVPQAGPIFVGKDACVDAAAESIGKRLQEKLSKTGKGGGVCGALLAMDNVKRAIANKEFGSLFETFPGLMNCLQENNKWLNPIINILAPAIKQDADAGKIKDLLSQVGVPKGRVDKFIEFAISKNIIKTGKEGELDFGSAEKIA